jgi:purine-binding chemotaxis protein CheW
MRGSENGRPRYARLVGAGDAQSESERQLIVFSLHGEDYGLPIASVQEIIRYTPPRVTAAARGLVQGLINLRGRVLPVLDLSRRLGATLQVSEATRILIIELAAGAVGLIVDAVDGVVEVPAQRIEPIPGAVGDDALGHEIAAIGDRLVMLIDPERALGGVLSGRAARDDAETPARDDAAAPARDRPADTDLAAPPQAPEPARWPRPSPPPARRRSAATPQMPRSPRPRQGKDSDE